MESPDNRLNSSRTEAAEVGAEEREQVALFSASGPDGAETREQPSRESSAVRGSGEGRRQPKQTREPQIDRHSTIQPLPPKHFPCYSVCVQPEDAVNVFKASHLLLSLPQNR